LNDQAAESSSYTEPVTAAILDDTCGDLIQLASMK
jgi:hypothetical protein